jgi:ligand-binding sensor domain-containing protein
METNTLSLAWIKITLILVFLSGTIAAQNSTPFFKTLNTLNGLSHKKVNCITQDKRGFIWVGTEDGLNRYDGRYFIIYRNDQGKNTSVSGNIISDLFEDKGGILWIATLDGGITKYDYRLPASKQFKQFKNDQRNIKSIPENGINKIEEDDQGNLWLATSGSYLVRFNKKTEIFDVPFKQGTKGILSLAKDRKGTLLVGRAGGGLLKVNNENGSYLEDIRYKNLYANLPHASITAIFKDSRNALWFGSWDNIVYNYSSANNIGNSSRLTNPLAGMPADEISEFTEDGNGRVWMAGKSTGISVYNHLTQNVTHLHHDPLKAGTIADDHTNAVYIDRQGVVWIGTNNGLSMYNQLFSPFVQYNLPAKKNTTIYDFFKDKHQRLWIATSEGIFIKDSATGTYDYREIIYKGQKLSVTKFFMDADNTMYIGTDYTLFRYDEKKNVISVLPNTDADPVMKKLISSRIVSIVRDTISNHPVLLVSPYGHFVTYYDLTDNRWISRGDSVKKILKKYNIKDNLIRKFYSDKKGDVWLATFKAGLGNWQQGDDAAIKYYDNDFNNSQSISSNNVYDILEDSKSNFWVSTYGGGLDYFNRGKKIFEHIKESSNLTEGMQFDIHENLWMLCNGHIHKYVPSAKTYSCYDLPSLQSTGGVKGYIYKDNENNLYAAGNNYYIVFTPDKVSNIIHEPTVYFTDFKVFDSSMSYLLQQKTIKLNHSQNYFSIEFSAPEFSGDNLFYSYMLEGIDKSWREANNQNIASYTNLPGGEYNFKVKASNWKGSNVTSYKAINITVMRPFWLQWWFFVTMALFVFTIGYGLYRHRVRAWLRNQAIRNGIAQDLHDQVGSTLSSISVYSEVAKIYSKQEKGQQLDTILDTIAVTANDMILEMADIVWAVNPKNDHLHSIVSRIESFAKPLCRIKGINFNMTGNTEYSVEIATMEARKNLYLILKEVVNNAIKHSKCKNLSVEVKAENKMIYAFVKDDGLGFKTGSLLKKKKHSLTGNGLDNIQFRAEELKANFSFDSTPGAGTLMKLSFMLQ